nr:putative serine/threonine-protein kinase pbl12 [Quercus suber]
MEVETRESIIYHKAFLEHREQVIQRDRLAPPRVLPINKSLPSIGCHKPLLYSMEELADMTDNFNEKNLIGETLFSKLYRGTIRHGWLPFEDWVVTVKIWDYTLRSLCYSNRRFLEAVVYDLNPLDTVRNLATTGSLTWLQRIKVALGFARALEFLHDPKKPYLVRNINAAHIILDQDCNPKIFDFSTMSGGILGKLTRPKEKLLNAGHDDPEFFPLGGPEEGGFEVTYHDVFSYGVVLLGLITKRIVDIENIRTTTLVYRWAWRQDRPNRYLVHESLVEDPGFYASDGISITELAMRCIQRELDKRPSMKDVVKHLEGLQAVQLHGNVVGMIACSVSIAVMKLIHVYGFSLAKYDAYCMGSTAGRTNKESGSAKLMLVESDGTDSGTVEYDGKDSGTTESEIIGNRGPKLAPSDERRAVLFITGVPLRSPDSAPLVDFSSGAALSAPVGWVGHSPAVHTPN